MECILCQLGWRYQIIIKHTPASFHMTLTNTEAPEGCWYSKTRSCSLVCFIINLYWIISSRFLQTAAIKQAVISVTVYRVKVPVSAADRHTMFSKCLTETQKGSLQKEEFLLKSKISSTGTFSVELSALIRNVCFI